MKLVNIFLAGVLMLVATSCDCKCNKNSECENAVIETIMARRSIRQYKDGPVARETMQTIMECGINAPSGQNRQSWEIRVVDDPAVMAEIIDLMSKGNPDTDKGVIKGCFRNKINRI